MILSKLCICILFCLFTVQTTVSQTVELNVDLNSRLGPMQIGKLASLGQGGLSEEPMLAGRLMNIKMLHPSLIRLFIQPYYNLLPQKGVYHFATLDKVVKNILKTGAKPLMTIVFKPRLLFPNRKDLKITDPTDYSKWEALVYNLVKHYQDMNAGIEYWEIANEPNLSSGGGTPYSFTPKGYTRFYKHTVEAILRANPNAKVGGPALAGYKSPILPALLRACSSENIPLDFISWHSYSDNNPQVVPQQMAYIKRLLDKHPDLNPETILDEWNMGLRNAPMDPRIQPNFVAEVIWQMKDVGIDRSCYYQIRDWNFSYDRFIKFYPKKKTAHQVRFWNREPQFLGLFDSENQIRPAYYTFKLLARLTGERLKVNFSSDHVHGFATYDSKLETYSIMAWNYSDKPVSVHLKLLDLSEKATVRHNILDVTGTGNWDNCRLRYEPETKLNKGDHTLNLTMKPFAVHFWSIYGKLNDRAVGGD